MRLLRLFNEKEGHEYLSSLGVDKELIAKLPLLGISSIGNLLSSIKLAKNFEYNENDVIFTVFTDSAEMYLSRLEEMNIANGKFTKLDAAKIFESHYKD